VLTPRNCAVLPLDKADGREFPPRRLCPQWLLHILSRLAQDGLICFGAREGKQQTFTLLDEWAPTVKRMERDESLAELAKQYFTSRCSATFPNLRRREVAAVVQYLLSGENKELTSEAAVAKQPKYRFTGYRRFLDPDDYPAIAPS